MTGRKRLRTPADLLRLPLLHLDDWGHWRRWLEAAGVPDAEVLHGPVLNRASMVIDAAVAGQGVALARTTLAASTSSTGVSCGPSTPRCVCRKATGSFARRRRRRCRR